jgi:hypothetical protein
MNKAMDKGMNIRIFGEQRTTVNGSVEIKEFSFSTSLDKLERLSGIRLMEMPTRKEGESLEEHMLAIEDEKERLFSELDDYIAKVFGVMDNESIRVKRYTIY